MNKPELLSPAGNMEKLKTAFLYGADAVYIGGSAFSLRAHAGNFSDSEITQAAEYAHSLGKKVYVTVNIFARNSDIPALRTYIGLLAQSGIDGVMVSDPGIIRLFKEAAPDLPLALSTQANCTNVESARFWEVQGIQRIVLARELSLGEIRQIADNTGVEIEVFIHGAICISWSGRCFISRYLTGRSANSGDCTHSCRWGYSLVEEERPGTYLPIEQDSRGSYIFNAKDICLLKQIPGLIQAGVASFKIEGRMKSVSYVASTTAAYRHAIDTYCNDPSADTDPRWEAELLNVSTRDLTEGFIRGEERPEDYVTDSHRELPSEFCGVAAGSDGKQLRIGIRNRIVKGDRLEILLPDLNRISLDAENLYSEREKTTVDAIHPNDTGVIRTEITVPEGCVIYRKL